MNIGGAGDVDRAEMIKWWDALDTLARCANVDVWMRGVRECRHPDARWLATLLPVGVEMTHERMLEVMLQQGEDPRARGYGSNNFCGAAMLLLHWFEKGECGRILQMSRE
jgi:hypothetical protein